MNPIPRTNTLADRMGLEVEYRGLNPMGQHLFSNGSPLVTDVFNTCEEAVARFGKRIKIDDAFLRNSTPYRDGLKATVYAPRKGADRIEQMEYANGYMRGLIARADAPSETVPAAPPAKPPAPPVAPPSPDPFDDDDETPPSAD